MGATIYADIPPQIRRQQRTTITPTSSQAGQVPQPPERTPLFRHLGKHTRARLLREFAKCHRIDVACANVGIHRGSHYKWLEKYPDYRAAFERLNTQLVDVMEGVCVERAMNGSDHMLMFWLKARNPKVFADRREDTLHVDGELSVADVIRQRRAQRLAEEKAAEVAKTIEVQAQIEAAPETDEG